MGKASVNHVMNFHVFIFISPKNDPMHAFFAFFSLEPYAELVTLAMTPGHAS